MCVHSIPSESFKKCRCYNCPLYLWCTTVPHTKQKVINKYCISFNKSLIFTLPFELFIECLEICMYVSRVKSTNQGSQMSLLIIFRCSLNTFVLYQMSVKNMPHSFSDTFHSFTTKFGFYYIL